MRTDAVCLILQVCISVLITGMRTATVLEDRALNTLLQQIFTEDIDDDHTLMLTTADSKPLTRHVLDKVHKTELPNYCTFKELQQFRAICQRK